MVSSQRCPCFFQDNLSYNVLLITMWIAYTVTRWWNRFLVTDVTRRQRGKLLRKCKKCKLPMAAHRKEGVFARSTNDHYQHSAFCVVHCCYHVFNNTLLPTCNKPLVMWLSIKPLAHPRGGGGYRVAAPKPQSEILKKRRFFRYDDIKRYLRLSLNQLPKLAD